MKLPLYILVSCFWFIPFADDPDTAPWELAKDSRGIVIYTRQAEGSDLKEFKAITTVKASMKQLVDLIENAENFPDWQPNISSAKIVTVASDHKIVYYTSDLPWPISDRDVVVRVSKSARESGEVLMTLASVPDAYPRREDYIRMVISHGTWRFIPQNNGQIKIIYQYHGDPAGSIPDWIINMFIVDGPFETLTNLKTIVSKKAVD